MKHASFPHKRSQSQVQELKPVHYNDAGTEGKISKFAWMTDGATRPIEVGLPVIGTPPPALDPKRPSPMDTLIKLIVEKPYLKEFYKTYGALAAAHPEYDLNDPDMMSHYEKQLIATYDREANEKFMKSDLKVRVEDPNTHQQKMSSQVPLDAHLHTWGGAIPYVDCDLFDDIDKPVERKRSVKKNVRTGLYGERDPDAPDEANLIRTVNFKTLQKEQLDYKLADDCATTPLVFKPGGRKFSTDITKMPGGTKDDTVKKCIKRFFDPEVGIPFVPKDAGIYFPLELLLPSNTQNDGENSARMSGSMSFVSNQSGESEEKSTLLETKNEDVLFTVNKAPFTRKDIASVRQFQQHWNNEQIKCRDKAAEALKRRQSMVRQAFHSRAVFNTYLKLLDEDCQRIRSGVIGKSKFKTKSLWEVAVETAPKDPSGLDIRREFWWRFCSFVRYLGGFTGPLERDFAKSVRIKLMTRHPINQSLFWDLVKEIKPSSMENVATLKLIEFCRVFLGIGKQEFDLFLDDINISRLIYTQTIVQNISTEFTEKLNECTSGPISIPECD